MKHHTLAFLALCCIGSAASSQLEVTGRIDKLASPPACSPKATHVVRCTLVYLYGNNVDLAPFEGKVAALTGSLALAACPTLEVRAAVASAFGYQITSSGTGKFKIGETASFRTTCPLLAAVPFLIAAGPSFVPLGPHGSLLIDPLSTLWLETNVALLGSNTVRIPLPNDKNFIGVRIWGQGIYLTFLPQLDGRALNADCFEITG
jgi:hypothetical protein